MKLLIKSIEGGAIYSWNIAIILGQPPIGDTMEITIYKFEIYSTVPMYQRTIRRRGPIGPPLKIFAEGIDASRC